jgi:MtrB/PioB family decaheme-associated outer membrane protein
MKRVQALLVAATVAGLAAAGPVHGSGEITFVGQNWWQTADEAKFQEFREWPNGAYIERFLARGRVGSFAATAWGNDLFLRQQGLGGSFDRGIRWQLDGSYEQQPHLFSLIARSPFTDLGGGVLVLSDSLQRQNQDNSAGFVNRMNAALAAAPFIPLAHRTDVTDARLRVRPTRGWQLELRGERRARTGSKPYGMSFGFSNANEVIEPLHQRMTDVSAAANYGRKNLSMRALLGYSSFDNRVDALVVDNPRRATDSPTAGSSVGRLDLYPDNHALRGQIDFTARLAQTHLSGTVALARHEQDDPWLPFTINSAIPQASLDSLYGGITARSTDGRALRFTQNWRVSRRFTDAVRGAVRFRQQHYSNETEEFPFRGVVQYDQSLSRDTVGFHNHPFGNEQITLGTDWDLRVADGVSLTAGYDHRWREHTFREVERDEEDEVRARLFAELSSGFYASAGYSFGSRRIDDLNLADYRRADAPDTVFLENPLLRRFDVADRDRQEANVELGWSPTDRYDVSFNGEYQRNEFDESRFGLQDDERWTLLAQLAFTPVPAWELLGGYGFGRTDTDQASQERSATAAIPIRSGNLEAGTDWSAHLRDRNDFGFVQSTWRAIPRTLSLVAGYWVSRDQVKYLLDNELGTAVNLPDTYYLRQEGRLEARYRLPDGTEISGRYGYDTWKVNDFAAKDIPLLGVAGTPPSATAIYLGAGFQNYTAHTLGFAISRRF